MISTCASLSNKSREGTDIGLWCVVVKGVISSMGVLQSIVSKLNVTWLTFTDHKLARLGYLDRLLYVCSHISFIISLHLQRQEIKC